MQIRAMMAELAPVIREYVAAETAPLVARINALEGRPLPTPKDGVGIANGFKDASGVLILTLTDGNTLNTGIRDGAPGKDAEPVEAPVLPELPDVEAMVKSEVAAAVLPAVEKAVAALPPAEPGKDGEDYDPEELRKAVAEAVAALPKPRDGESVTLDDVAPVVAQAVTEAVQRAVEGLPVAKDGVGLAGAMIDRDGGLILTLTDGSTKALGRVVGKDGEPGKAGNDGLGFDDLSVDYDGERTLTFKWARGEKTREHSLKLSHPIYRGVREVGRMYERGDSISYGGNTWIAMKDTDAQPAEGPDWKMAVRRGRDGKDVVKLSRDPKEPVKI